MDKKKMQQLIVVLPILLIGLAFGFYKYLFSPLDKKSDALIAELRKIKQEYQESEARAARLPRLEQEIVFLNKEIGEIEKKLPPTKDVPNLIRTLSKKMNLNNITWSRLAPGTQSVKDYYVEHSYSIPFMAPFHNLAQFLSDIGQMERIFATRFTRLGTTTDARTGAVQAVGELIFLIYTSKG